MNTKRYYKQESSRKTSISALLTMPKPLTVWITRNCAGIKIQVQFAFSFSSPRRRDEYVWWGAGKVGRRLSREVGMGEAQGQEKFPGSIVLHVTR